MCTGAVVTSDGLWWLFTLAGLQLHFPKHDSFPAWLWVRVGLKKKKKKNSHEIRRQTWSSHQVQNVNLKSGVTAVITQCHGTLGSLAWGSNWAYSSFSSCQSSTFAFPNNTGAGLCAAPWWGVPHLLQITYIIKVEGYLHHQGCRCGSSESHESSSLGS